MSFITGSDERRAAVSGSRRFRTRRYGSSYFFAGFALLLGLVTGLFGSWKPAVVALFLVLGVVFVLNDLLTTIALTDDHLRVGGLRLPRKLRYEEIADATMGQTNAGGLLVKTIELRPADGRRIRIVPYQFAGFYGHDGWAAMLLAAFDSHHVQVEPDLMRHLTRAASRPEATVGAEQRAFDDRREEPPISF